MKRPQMNLDEMLEVIQQLKNGNAIQRMFNPQITSDTIYPWEDFTGENESFNFDKYLYRVRREPKIIYLNEYEHGFENSSAHLKFSDAEKHTAVGVKRIGVKFQEVI